MRQMLIEPHSLPLARPFAIARGTRTAVDVVRVTLSMQGKSGWGECTPTAHYQETVASVVEQLESVRAQVEGGASLDQVQALLPPGAARNAVDCALWRLQAALAGETLFQHMGVVLPESIVTAETLSLDSLDNMVLAAADAVSRGALLLKIKLNQHDVLPKVAAIREVAPETSLIIDANEGWGDLALGPLFESLSAYGIEMVEQPLPAGHDDGLADIVHPFPICADESCHGVKDIAGLKDRYDMINIKLDKCGGISEALAMVSTAQSQQMRVMVGCMLGSSLAMQAALPAALQAEYVDLDGPIWLAEDCAPHLRYDRGRIWL